MKTIGIVIATRWEAAPIIRALGFRRVKRGFYKIQTPEQTVLIKVSGMGKEPARKAAYELCSAGAQELVSAGYCGALTPDLSVGDLLTDRIATSASALWRREDRLALAARAGAQAVDMETQAVIEAGTRRGVPIRVLRVVSDRLDDDFTPLFDSGTEFSPFRIALRLWNPRRWPLLYKLWRQSRAASRRLIEAVAAYLKQPSL